MLRLKGIRQSSVAEVMGGVGLTVGGFYAHFASKEALFEETLRTSARRMLAILDDVHGRTAAERAARVLARYLSPAHVADVEGGCIMPAAVPDIAQLGQPYRDALVPGFEAFISKFAVLLGGDRGARQHALALAALMYGGLSLARAFEGTPLQHQLLAACQGFARAALASNKESKCEE